VFRTDRPRRGTDRFSVSAGDANSVFEDVFVDHKLIEKDTQPLEAVMSPCDNVNASLNDLILENFMIECKFNRKTFLSAFDALRDPGSFTLDVKINKKPFRDCVLDSGSSMNVMSIYLARLAKIQFKKIKPRKDGGIMLVDGTIRDPKGFAHRVPVDVEGRVVPLDFVLMDAVEDCRVVLGRPFLFETQASLNYEEMSVRLLVNGEWLTYKKRTTENPMELSEIPRSPLREERLDDESRKRKRDNLVIILETGSDDEEGKVEKDIAKRCELVKDPAIEQWLDDALKMVEFGRDDCLKKEDLKDGGSLSDACSSSVDVSLAS